MATEVPAATALPGGYPAYTGGPTTIRFGWWGNDDRAARTNKVIDLFQKAYPTIKVTGEPNGGTADHFQIIDTQLAGNNAPDLIQFGGNYPDYIKYLQSLNDYLGKQLLITRGSLTTFSIANDIAKYFAIIPAAFSATYPQLNALNLMHLATPSSAILSAVIFNALIIIALIPLALKGVSYRAAGAHQLLRRNLLIYGLGGIVVPFVGIKLIDVLLVALGLA